MNNFESDISSLAERARTNDEFAKHLYAALCNVSWKPIGAEHEPECELATGVLNAYRAKHVRVNFVNNEGKLEQRPPGLSCTCKVSFHCTWRYAGGLVANLRNKNEDYLDFYCSGGEGTVAPEIRKALESLGWEPTEGETELLSITFSPPDTSGEDAA